MRAYNREELEALLDLAEEYNGRYLPTMVCHHFYRNKDEFYFQQVEHRGGLMEPIRKDNGGDPCNPINGRLSGVFFGASSMLPGTSIYGPKRIKIFSKELMDEECQLYFADFYCFGGPHYVQLVLVPKKQVPHIGILNELVELDIRDNPFIIRMSNNVYVTRRSKLWLEIFYTDSVDVRHLIDQGKASFEQNTVVGRGSSVIGGVRKNRTCSTCNITPGMIQRKRQDTMIRGSPMREIQQLDMAAERLPGSVFNLVSPTGRVSTSMSQQIVPITEDSVVIPMQDENNAPSNLILSPAEQKLNMVPQRKPERGPDLVSPSIMPAACPTTLSPVGESVLSESVVEIPLQDENTTQTDPRPGRNNKQPRSRGVLAFFCRLMCCGWCKDSMDYDVFE